MCLGVPKLCALVNSFDLPYLIKCQEFMQFLLNNSTGITGTLRMSTNFQSIAAL